MTGKGRLQRLADGTLTWEEHAPAGLLDRTRAWLKPIGDLRDGVLIVASLVYICGYAIWSFYAWQSNLGLLPALEFQYLVAGLVPLAIIAMAVFAGRHVRHFLLDVWPRLVGPGVTGWRLGIRLLLRLLWVGAVAALLIGSWASSLAPELEASIRRPVIWILLVAFILQPPNTRRSERLVDRAFGWLFRAYRAFLVYFSVAGVVLIAVVFYAERVYPNLAQEFGGVRPRCAYIDVAREELSDETLAQIFPTAAGTGSGKSVRSIKVDVLFAGRDTLLVRPSGSQPGTSRTTHEISRDVVKAVTWCE